MNSDDLISVCQELLRLRKGKLFLLPSPFLAAQTLDPAVRRLLFPLSPYSSKTNLHTRSGGQERPPCLLPNLDPGFKSFYLAQENACRIGGNEKNKNAYNVQRTALES